MRCTATFKFRQRNCLLTRSASEGRRRLPRWRFGLVSPTTAGKNDPKGYGSIRQKNTAPSPPSHRASNTTTRGAAFYIDYIIAEDSWKCLPVGIFGVT